MITKPKWQVISPEKCIVNEPFAFSFNPENQPELYKGNETLTLFSDWQHNQFSFFKKLKYCTLNIVLEMSCSGRFHYHGTIKFINILKFFFYDLKILMFHGAGEIDSISDAIKWKEYCSKQDVLMKQFCKEKDMIYEINFVPIVCKAKNNSRMKISDNHFSSEDDPHDISDDC